MLVLILVIVCASIGLLYVLKWWKKQKRLLEMAALIPMMEGRLPIIGHAKNFVGNPEKFWENMKKIMRATESAGGVMSLWIGPSLQFTVTDPDDILRVLNSRLAKNSYFYKMAAPWIGDGLLVANVPNWKQNRKLVNPTFSQHMLDGFMFTFNAQSEWAIDEFAKHAGKGEFNPWNLLSDLTLKAICFTALGITKDDENILDQEYKDAVGRIFDILTIRICKYWLHSDIIYRMSSLKREENVVVKILQNMSSNMIAKRKAERKATSSKTTSASRFQSFLDLLLDMEDEGLVSHDRIKTELNTIIAAGHDTSSRALLYTMILLGSHPEVQDKLFQEINTVIGCNEVKKDDLNKMPYMEAVIKESMRIYPPIPMVARLIDEDLKLKNYTLPAGTGTVLCFYQVHRLKSLWGADAEDFRPERWLDPDSLPKSPGAYCAFSAGRRNCIGKSYAYMSMKTTLAHFVRRFRIKADYTKLRVKFEILLKPICGDDIALELR